MPRQLRGHDVRERPRAGGGGVQPRPAGCGAAMGESRVGCDYRGLWRTGAAGGAMMRYWLIILGMGLVTYAVRLSIIALSGRSDVPPAVRRALRFVPPAVLTALAAPAIIRPEGVVNLSVTNIQLIAGSVAALVAWKTRSALFTIAVGMAMLWTLRAVLH